MVESTKGVGQVQNLVTGKAQAAANEKRVTEKKAAASDKVEISQKALDLSQAQQAASDARVALEKDQDATLGLNPSLLDETV